ncbi:uncharacterized protein LOC127849919 [Dreissena polymorpha]|uniref:uncharacterized protein LOC127849919 n=1 Tax=Dreissena polymorpha TaxID=45954 RepID=UPI002265656E|nr:uncharacterized protein LOC127849919 [Dreissena polymorpha]
MRHVSFRIWMYSMHRLIKDDTDRFMEGRKSEDTMKAFIVLFVVGAACAYKFDFTDDYFTEAFVNYHNARTDVTWKATTENFKNVPLEGRMNYIKDLCGTLPSPAHKRFPAKDIQVTSVPMTRLMLAPSGQTVHQSRRSEIRVPVDLAGCQGHLHSKVSKVTEMSLAQADLRDQKRALTYITKGDLCPD